MPFLSPPFASCRIRCGFLHQHQLLLLPIDRDWQRIRVQLSPEGGEFFGGQFVHEAEESGSRGTLRLAHGGVDSGGGMRRLPG